MQLLKKTKTVKENFADNHLHNNLGHFDLLPNYHFSKVKRCAIIYYDVYELPYELLNDLRARII